MASSPEQFGTVGDQAANEQTVWSEDTGTEDEARNKDRPTVQTGRRLPLAFR